MKELTDCFVVQHKVTLKKSGTDDNRRGALMGTHSVAAAFMSK